VNTPPFGKIYKSQQQEEKKEGEKNNFFIKEVTITLFVFNFLIFHFLKISF
jgi:hypothetical protein